jgi:hypothetical protein
MRLEAVRKQYVDGLLLRDEAVQLITVIGKSRSFAERYLDHGLMENDVRVVAGSSQRSLLVITDR